MPSPKGQRLHLKVTGTQTAQRVGSQYLGKDAQGTFLIVAITVTNHGDQVQMFDGSGQKVLDAAGREFSPDNAAGIYLGNAESFLNNINPGNTVKGRSSSTCLRTSPRLA